jgi:hypothetical protein
MKQTPDEQRIAARMAPGVLALEGFLGRDRRPLGEILAADGAAVARLGLTHAEVADRLAAAYAAAAAALGTPVDLGDRRSAVANEAMGRIPCPWGDRRLFPKGEVELTDTRTDAVVRFSALSVHLVAAHGFYGGLGSRYRLDPALVARLTGR